MNNKRILALFILVAFVVAGVLFFGKFLFWSIVGFVSMYFVVWSMLVIEEWYHEWGYNKLLKKREKDEVRSCESD